jgi:predicted  nucleic acid-binding Zn-ribbon protein
MLLLGGVAGLFLFLKTAGLSKEAKQRQVQLDKEIKQLNDSIENCDNKIKDLKKDTTDIGDDLKELENDSEYKLKADLLKAAKEVEEDFRKKGKVLRYDSKGRPHYLDIPDEKKNERLEKETSKYETDKIDPKRKELEQKKSELENCSKRKEYFVYQKDSLEKQLQLITRPQKNETKAGNVASPYSEQY